MSDAIFARVAVEEGWTEATQIAVLLRYIENQQAVDAFLDFLEEQRADTSNRLDTANSADDFLRDVADRLQRAGLLLDADFQEFCGNVHDLLTIEQAAESWRRRTGY